MIDTEQRMVDTAERMAGAGTHGVDTRHVQEAIDRRGSLSDEQRQAVERVTEDGRMAVVVAMPARANPSQWQPRVRRGRRRAIVFVVRRWLARRPTNCRPAAVLTAARWHRWNMDGKKAATRSPVAMFW